MKIDIGIWIVLIVVSFRHLADICAQPDEWNFPCDYGTVKVSKLCTHSLKILARYALT